MKRLLTPSSAWWLLAALLAVAIGVGHDGRRVAQLVALALPALLWLRWPMKGGGAHRLRTLFVGAWMIAFGADAAVRGYLLQAYGAAPDSAMVVGAMANTGARESAEYLETAWPMIAAAAAVLLPLLGAMVLLCGLAGARAGLPAGAPAPGARRLRVAVLLLLVLVVGAAYASKPWRRLHPLAFWPGWVQSVVQQRAQWADQSAERQRGLEQALAAAPALADGAPRTVVLVVSESIVRDNLGLYGYARETTPRLQAARVALGASLLVLPHAWSAAASTLPALESMFHLPAAPGAARLHLLSLARAAGYRVWWIGNQDDLAIEQLHARRADEMRLMNRVPGRASASLDAVVLPGLREALDDPHPHKLIVLHLMGAHPHYDLRYPAGDNPWADADDPVERAMTARGRPAWLRRLRGDYDAALRYHDGVVAESLRMTRDATRAGGSRAWVFVSDHGQEVGHDADHAGHSPTTAAGYRIPALVWTDPPRPADEAGRLAGRPFRADWLASTVTGLLGLRLPGLDGSQDVLAAGYRWQPPALPVADAGLDAVRPPPAAGAHPAPGLRAGEGVVAIDR